MGYMAFIQPALCNGITYIHLELSPVILNGRFTEDCSVHDLHFNFVKSQIYITVLQMNAGSDTSALNALSISRILQHWDF